MTIEEDHKLEEKIFYMVMDEFEDDDGQISNRTHWVSNATLNPNVFLSIAEVLENRTVITGLYQTYLKSKWMGIYSYQNENGYHRYEGQSFINITQHPQDNQWFLYGHRIDGPAYQHWLVKQGMGIKNLSENDKFLIDVKWRKL